MKILLIAPTSGGINIYVNVLTNYLRKLSNSVDIFSTNLSGRLYSPETKKWIDKDSLLHNVEESLSHINWNDYDMLAFHYGKNDPEQLVPIFLRDDKNLKDKSVYFVHYLSWNLFSDFIPDQELFEAITKSTSEFKHLVFFGSFARNYWHKKYSGYTDDTISFLPETHSQETLTKEDIQCFKQLVNIDSYSNLPLIVWEGYPANYKNHALLLDSLSFLTHPIHLVFAGRGWAKRLQNYPSEINGSKITIVDREISSKEYKYFSMISNFGIFLYEQPQNKKEIFQGSGTLPNYLYNGKACICLDEGALPEYIGKAGIILKNKSPKEVAYAINTLQNTNTLEKYESEAGKRKYLFSPDYHAKVVNNYLDQILQKS